MKVFKQVMLVALVAGLAGCATTYKAKVNFDKNEQISTTDYKTFAWLKESKILSAPTDINPVMKVRVDEAIERAFIAKGYTLVESPQTADFTVSYTVGSRDKVRVDSFPTAYRAGWGWGRGYYGGYYGNVVVGSDTHVRNYTEGKLAIDVFDVRTKQPTWHGWAVKRMSKADNDDSMATIKTVVDEVVANFE